jgi:hypothetical protein
MSNRTFSILGDSISTFKGYHPQQNEVFYPREEYDVKEVEQTWWSILAKRMDLTLLCNESYSGARVSYTGARPATSCFQHEERQKCLKGSMIIVFGGTNDWGQLDDPTTLEIFAQAYDSLVSSMLLRHSDSALYFCTPLQRIDRSLTTPNIHGWTQLDTAQTIRDIVNRYSKANLIDLSAHHIEANSPLLPDGVHPGKEGMELLASLMEGGLTSRQGTLAHAGHLTL